MKECLKVCLGALFALPLPLYAEWETYERRIEVRTDGNTYVHTDIDADTGGAYDRGQNASSLIGAGTTTGSPSSTDMDAPRAQLGRLPEDTADAYGRWGNASSLVGAGTTTGSPSSTAEFPIPGHRGPTDSAEAYSYWRDDAYGRGERASSLIGTGTTSGSE